MTGTKSTETKEDIQRRSEGQRRQTDKRKER